MPSIRLKKLQEYLEGVDGFEQPKVLLEQYVTPPHIASTMLYNIQSKYDDIEGKIVGDLGCGCGILSIGCSLLGAQFTVGFEIDPAATKIFRQNVTEMELPSIDCIQMDILKLQNFQFSKTFDTIVMNPPFGTKNNAGIDISFIKSAIGLAKNAVYSLHKSSTRDYIRKKIIEWKIKGEVIAEVEYNIDNCYRFHKQKFMDIKVDLWRFEVS